MAVVDRQILAEVIGTAALVATVVGSGIMADRLTDDIALALLANTAATAAILYVLITIFGPVSGAQFNPAVTAMLAAKRELPVQRATGFILAQIIGGVAGCLLAHAMYDLPLMQVSQTVRHGAGQWLSEGVATFGLILTILLGRRSPEKLAGLVALYIAAAYWFTASTSFANPAVTIARALTDSFAGIRPADVLPFIAAQAVGTVLAVIAHRGLQGAGGADRKGTAA